MSYFNPYYGQTFWGFLWQLGQRIMQGSTDLATDEVQLIVLMSVGASTALVGTFLVLRKMTMLANALSHTILIGIVFVFMLTHNGLLGDGYAGAGSINIQAMLIAAILTGLVTAYLTEFLTKTAKLQADASTGLVFTTLFALGVILVTVLTRDAHIGTEVVMGNADALHIDDCKLVGIILLINVIIITVAFKEYKITTFDRGLANALGISAVFFDYLLMSQVSVTAIGAFRAVGVLMVLAFITGPVLTARLYTHNLKTLLILSVVFGCLCSLTGVALSRHLLTVYGIALSTAGVVVCVIVALFLISIGISRAGPVVTRTSPA